jgi:hypothetical protein
VFLITKGENMHKIYLILFLIILLSGCNGSKISNVEIHGNMTGFGISPEVLLIKKRTDSKKLINNRRMDLSSFYLDTIRVESNGNFLHKFDERQEAIIIPWFPVVKTIPKHTHPPYVGLLINKEFFYTFSHQGMLTESNLYIKDSLLGFSQTENRNVIVEYIQMEKSETRKLDWKIILTIKKEDSDLKY